MKKPLMPITRRNQKGFAHVELVLVLIVVAAIAGVGWYVLSKNKKNNNDQVANTQLPKEEIKPALTYKGAYNGKLYLTGEKVGDSAPWNSWKKSLDRNGVETAIAYF